MAIGVVRKLVDELHALRLKRDRADAVFLLRCVDVEEEYWKIIHEDLKCASYAQFLKSNSILEPARYDNFKAGLAKIGREKALEIGGDATIIAARLSNGAAQVRKYVEAIDAWRMKNHDAQPSNQAAERLLYQVDPREREPQAVSEMKLINQLRAENAELRAKLRTAEAKIKQLQKQLGKQPRA